MLHRVWIKEGRRTRKRFTGQRRRITKCQERRFRQLALEDRFVTTSIIADQWFGKKVDLLVCVHTNIAAFEHLDLFPSVHY